MGYTRHTGQLSYLITYDGSGNITVPASFTQTTVTSSMLKADSAGKLVAAVAGTDFVAPAGLSSYVPTSRTITINGTAYDLSADRSWSIVSGVSSFNTRTGAITLTSGDVTTALGYTPVTNARTITINGTSYDLSADRSWSIVSGVSSFNTRTGAITLADTDVTGALGYTPVTNARTITINGTTYDLSTNRTWVVDTSVATTRVVQKFTATASQTTFTVTGGYTVGMVDVFLNGIKLDNATEFTATDSSTVVLAAAAASGDIVEVYKYGGQFIANNSLRQTTAFTATAGQTTFTVTYSVGFVDVFYNGSKLAASEFTATNGTSIVLGTACVLNDIVEVVAYNYTVGAFTGVGGSGTANYHAKWTASGTLGNSLIYDNGTNVGIGTTNPGSYAAPNLAVVGNTSGNMGITIDNTYTSTASGTTSLFLYNNSAMKVRLDYARDVDAGIIGTTTSIPMLFYANGSERMRITAAGGVGIGVTAPNHTLAINGAVGLYSNATTQKWHIQYNSANDGLNFVESAIADYRMFIKAGGNVGIGTSSPNSKLTIVDNSAPNSTGNITTGTQFAASIASGLASLNVGAYDDGASNRYGYLRTAFSDNAGVTSEMRFYTGATERMRLGASGNFGIGVNPDSNVRLAITGASAGTSAYSIYTRDSNSSEIFSVRNDGIMRVINQPAFSMYCSASVTGPAIVPMGGTIFNDGGYYNTSTYRFTAPCAGRYFFSFYDNVMANNANPTQFMFRVNGSNRGAIAYTQEKTVGNWYLMSFQQVIKLNSGDYVEVYNNSADRTDYGNQEWGNFSGYLLG